MRTDPEAILAERVRSNNDWLAQAQNFHREQMRRDGEFARTIRKKRRLSLRDVALRMGVSVPFLSYLERGDRYWTTAQIETWGKAIEEQREGGR